MRPIGLDVHRDCCEVAVFEDGQVTQPPRVPATQLITPTAATMLEHRAARRPTASRVVACREVEIGGHLSGHLVEDRRRRDVGPLRDPGAALPHEEATGPPVPRPTHRHAVAVG
jgi:hypothetical protein